MSLVLQPQKAFTVVRQIANHLDETTYYVRAVIRNAYTDELIETLDLTDRGAQRFSKNWQVPADPSGEGHYISIVTSVYTDSGYTTKSENYGDEENTYLVQDRSGWSHGRGGGALGISDIRRVIREELDKLEKPEGVDYDRLKPASSKDRTDEILAAIRANKPEKAEKVDLTPLLQAIDGAKQAIEAKEVTPATDLSDLASRLESMASESGTSAQELKGFLATQEEALTRAIQEGVRKEIAATQFVSALMNFADGQKVFTKALPPTEEPTQEIKDPKSLAL